MRHVLALVHANAGEFFDDFDEWLIDNWSLWLRFEAEALRVVSRGRRHYSVATIVEYLRHETSMRETGGDWKINNDRRADLARIFRLVHPAHGDLFATRERRSARVADLFAEA